MRTNAAKVNSVLGLTFKRATHGSPCVSSTHVCARARARACAIYCAALSKEISPGAPKPFHTVSIKCLFYIYCAALFFLFLFFFFNNDVEPWNRKVIRPPLIVQIGPPRPDSYLSRYQTRYLRNSNGTCPSRCVIASHMIYVYLEWPRGEVHM